MPPKTQQTEPGAYIQTVRQYAVLHRKYAKEIGPTGVACYCALMSHLRDGVWACYPSQSTLANEMGHRTYKGVDKRAQNAVKILDAAGLVEVERRKGGGRNAPNLYKVREIWKEYDEVRSDDDYPARPGVDSNRPIGADPPANTVEVDSIADVAGAVNTANSPEEYRRSDNEIPPTTAVEVGPEVGNEVSTTWIEWSEQVAPFRWESSWGIPGPWRFAARCLPPELVDSAYARFQNHHEGKRTEDTVTGWAERWLRWLRGDWNHRGQVDGSVKGLCEAYDWADRQKKLQDAAELRELAAMLPERLSR